MGAEILGAFGKAISIFLELKQVSIDNWCFKLFYKITTSLLLICSVLTTFKSDKILLTIWHFGMFSICLILGNFSGNPSSVTLGPPRMVLTGAC